MAQRKDKGDPHRQSSTSRGNPSKRARKRKKKAATDEARALERFEGEGGAQPQFGEQPLGPIGPVVPPPTP